MGDRARSVLCGSGARREMIGDALRTAVQCRVLIDNDWAGDPDGLVALAHHLLSPTNRVTAITSSFLNPVFGELGPTAERGAELARELVELIGGTESPAVHVGSAEPFRSGEPGISAAARIIIDEAHSDDPMPLYVVCAGPLTNVAAAIDHAPAITSKFTLVWVGGALTAGAFEYNRDTDAAAADFVFANPDLRIYQFPMETYRLCAYSAAELQHDMATSGMVGTWLWRRFVELPLPEWIRLGGVWPLGDSPPLLVTALSDESSQYSDHSGADNALRRTFTTIDSRLIVGDMLAKLRLHELRRRQ